MAVVMEVPWSRATGELGSNSPAALELTKGKKASSSSPSQHQHQQQQHHASWGADAQKVVQLMMGQLRSSPSAGEQRQVEDDDDDDDDVTTLDLLGCNNINININNNNNNNNSISKAVAPSSSHQREEFTSHHNHNSNSAEFLELDPDQPLPPGWEKCLDLKTGKLYFVNKQTGARTNDDPRKHQKAVEIEPLAHEFLCSKQSETLREHESMRASSSSSSGGSPHATTTREALSAEKQLWSLCSTLQPKITQRRTSSPDFEVEEMLQEQQQQEEEESNHLELDLNLAAGAIRSSPQRQQHGQFSVCTMEMVQNALKRTGELKRKNSLLSFKSEQQASPSTSSSSSTSSKSSSLLANLEDSLTQTQTQTQSPVQPRAFGEQAECLKVSGEISGALVMGACTRCLMYVMLNKSDPICPRCESKVPLDHFTAPVAPSSKRQRRAVDGGASGSSRRH